MIWVMVSYFCLGGHFTIFPTAAGYIFGNELGPKVYAIIFTGFGTTSLMGFFIAKFALPIIGY